MALCLHIPRRAYESVALSGEAVDAADTDVCRAKEAAKQEKVVIFVLRLHQEEKGMSRDCNWRDAKAIDRWVEKWREDVEHDTLSFAGEDDPIDELQKRLDRGDFTGRNKASVSRYLKHADANARRVREWGDADRKEPVVGAADSSATWAVWAAATVFVVFVFFAWPYIKHWID